VRGSKRRRTVIGHPGQRSDLTIPGHAYTQPKSRANDKPRPSDETASSRHGGPGRSGCSASGKVKNVTSVTRLHRKTSCLAGHSLKERLHLRKSPRTPATSSLCCSRRSESHTNIGRSPMLTSPL
jgi:hypothetical protein